MTDYQVFVFSAFTLLITTLGMGQIWAQTPDTLSAQEQKQANYANFQVKKRKMMASYYALKKNLNLEADAEQIKQQKSVGTYYYYPYSYRHHTTAYDMYVTYPLMRDYSRSMTYRGYYHIPKYHY